MSLFLRCQWIAPDAPSLADRVVATGESLARESLLTRLGPHWFKTGRSRKDALKVEVDLQNLEKGLDHFRRVPLVGDAAYHALDVWNGRPDREAATFSLFLYDPPARPDTVVLDVEQAFLRRTVDWAELLGIARDLCNELGGCAILSSHELLAWAEKNELEEADYAAYAAFWGPDRSGRNPLHRFLAGEGAVRHELVACESWEVTADPSEVRAREVAKLVARASAAAGAQVRL